MEESKKSTTFFGFKIADDTEERTRNFIERHGFDSGELTVRNGKVIEYGDIEHGLSLKELKNKNEDEMKEIFRQKLGLRMCGYKLDIDNLPDIREAQEEFSRGLTAKISIEPERDGRTKIFIQGEKDMEIWKVPSAGLVNQPPEKMRETLLGHVYNMLDTSTSEEMREAGRKLHRRFDERQQQEEFTSAPKTKKPAHHPNIKPELAPG